MRLQALTKVPLQVLTKVLTKVPLEVPTKKLLSLECRAGAHGWTAGLRYKEASALWSGACVAGTRVQVGRRLDADRDGRAAGNVSASRDLVRVHPSHLAQPDIEPSAPKSLLSQAF